MFPFEWDLQSSDKVLVGTSDHSPAARINRVAIPVIKNIMRILEHLLYGHKSLYCESTTSVVDEKPIHKKRKTMRMREIPSKLTPFGDKSSAKEGGEEEESHKQKNKIEKIPTLPLFTAIELTLLLKNWRKTRRTLIKRFSIEPSQLFWLYTKHKKEREWRRRTWLALLILGKKTERERSGGVLKDGKMQTWTNACLKEIKRQEFFGGVLLQSLAWEVSFGEFYVTG